MKITELNGKNVCMLGYGREGKAMVETIEKFAPDCTVTIADGNETIEVPSSHQTQLGEGWLSNLDTFDLLIVSPGIPPRVLPKTTTPITNSTQIFLDSIDPAVTVVGVTGSKGKSTTASLVHHIVKAAGKDTVLLGNIGTAAITALDTIKPSTIVVLEMSSYQLMRVTRSPQVALITSFFPEHLDYHGTLEEYKAAKQHITKFQTPDDTVYYYEHSEGAQDIAAKSKGTKQAYNEDNSPIAVQDTKLIGTHNLFNIAGAATVARHFGIDDQTIIDAARTFTPLAHRLQYVGTVQGVHWVDDAISTTPESTIAAVRALSPRVKTIIVGGQDRGNTFDELGEVLAACGVETVIFMGESGPRIAETTNLSVRPATNMEEAVQIALETTTAEGSSIPICLLSPASPGYDMYKSFEEKGADYQSTINQLQK